MTTRWSLLRSGPGNHAFNMALDHALLKAMPRLLRPVLRFYSWEEGAASFGYFQRAADVERATHLRPLVRRPTGGGIVPHDGDWTYSLAFPTNHEWYFLKAVESYRRVHEWIQGAFARMQIPTELASEAKRSEPGRCFAGHEKFDVLWHGRKIAGAAQRRTRDGLLIQGSVQPVALSVARTDWEDALCEVASRRFGTEWSELNLDSALQTEAANLAARIYSQDSYNRKR